MKQDENYWAKLLVEKDKKCNEYCAKIRRDEFRLVVNNGRSDIDGKQYN